MAPAWISLRAFLCTRMGPSLAVVAYFPGFSPFLGRARLQLFPGCGPWLVDTSSWCGVSRDHHATLSTISGDRGSWRHRRFKLEMAKLENKERQGVPVGGEEEEGGERGSRGLAGDDPPPSRARQKAPPSVLLIPLAIASPLPRIVPRVGGKPRRRSTSDP